MITAKETAAEYASVFFANNQTIYIYRQRKHAMVSRKKWLWYDKNGDNTAVTVQGNKLALTELTKWNLNSYRKMTMKKL